MKLNLHCGHYGVTTVRLGALVLGTVLRGPDGYRAVSEGGRDLGLFDRQHLAIRELLVFAAF